MSNISVFGIGYVGTVTACCLAHQGNRVIGVDLSSDKVQALQAGHSPIIDRELTIWSLKAAQIYLLKRLLIPSMLLHKPIFPFCVWEHPACEMESSI